MTKFDKLTYHMLQIVNLLFITCSRPFFLLCTPKSVLHSLFDMTPLLLTLHPHPKNVQVYHWYDKYPRKKIQPLDPLHVNLCRDKKIEIGVFNIPKIILTFFSKNVTVAAK